MQTAYSYHPTIIASNQQARNVTDSKEHYVVELFDVLSSCVILPFISDDLLHHSTVQIGYFLVNVGAQLGDEFLLVEHGHVDLEVFLIILLRYVSQRAVKVFMKWHELGHEPLEVAMDHALVEEAGRVRLSHELEEPSDDGGVR